MDKLAVNGDSIVLQPVGFMWQGWDGKLPLQGGNLITSEGKSVILEKDVLMAALGGMGKMYVAPPFATPGSVVNLQLTVIPATLSLSVATQSQAVVTAATMGTYTATVVPAMNPQGVPDPLVTKMGQWTVETTSQSAFRSGVPAVVPPAGDSDASGEGDSEKTEAKVHWVGVSIEDTAGNPLANQSATLELSNGEVLTRTLGDSGATRVDNILLDEDNKERTCIVRVVFDPKRVPVKREPQGFITIQVVDEDGTPFSGREATLVLPGGEKRTRTLDELGRTRFVGVPIGARCDLEILPAQVLLEFTLTAEDGQPLAGMAFTVTDSTGAELKGVLDDDGFASVTVAEGECEVKVDFTSEGNGNGDGNGNEGGSNNESDDEAAPSDGNAPAESSSPPAEGGNADEATERTHIELLGEDEKPMANTRVLIARADGTQEEHTLDAAGKLELVVSQGEELSVNFPDHPNARVATSQ
jgi:Contractile injection system spike tip protein